MKYPTIVITPRCQAVRPCGTRPVPPDGLREALDAIAVAVLDRLAEAADSIRGGVADAGREQCSREWAAQQVGYYASSAVGMDFARLRKAVEAAALADIDAAEVAWPEFDCDGNRNVALKSSALLAVHPKVAP